MPATPTWGLRYPAATDPADVPLDLQELATDVEAAIPPKGVSVGQVPVWDGTKWIADDSRKVGGLSAIADTTLGAAAASIAFSSIPQTYRHLVLAMSVRASSGTNGTDVDMRINGVASSSYSWAAVRNTGGTVGGIQAQSDTLARIGDMLGSPTSTLWAAILVFISDYANATRQKSFASIGGGYMMFSPLAFAVHYGGVFTGAAAITSLQLGCFAGGFSFDAGSRATLYGMA